ncbi:winged helix-turn-helix domain-containing protein [Falsirhodobacter sp. 20TX0035]|uniref:winged helix-turn-helix domain-containing protein n=1 Tax=Falsirhodobacter sp. 20TX0035 TaxID=3022019 RepID=UPI002330DDD5|nr:winged helix-turn-helix domain-containing protein [Falsirhodobacter sp. 20TX0035]MDB6455116.1 winged helix-turn-helix domain-containing protein [Falsirhodobacter sp. 20TX0035]
MHTIRTEILSLPHEERLSYALHVIDTLVGQALDDIAWVRRHLGVSKKQAQMILALNAAFPRTLSKEQIMTAIHGPGWEQDERAVAVMASHIRARHPDLIETCWGLGYRLARKIEVGNDVIATREKAGEAWSPEEDDDLRRMFENGSDISIIADEMDRSERSISDRWRLLRKRAEREQGSGTDRNG